MLLKKRYKNYKKLEIGLIIMMVLVIGVLIYTAIPLGEDELRKTIIQICSLMLILFGGILYVIIGRMSEIMDKKADDKDYDIKCLNMEIKKFKNDLKDTTDKKQIIRIKDKIKVREKEKEEINKNF